MSNQGLPNQQFTLSQFAGQPHRFPAPFDCTSSGPVNGTPQNFMLPMQNTRPIMQPRQAQPVHSHPSTYSMSNFEPTVGSTDTSLQQLLAKPSNELNAGDILQIVQIANKSINDKIDNLSNEMNTKITSLKGQIKNLEKVNKEKDDDISVLKYTITGMQRSLNMIDSKERNTNVIITGVPETDIVIQNEEEVHRTTLSEDKEKIRWILKLIDCHHFDEVEAFCTNLSNILIHFVNILT